MRKITYKDCPICGKEFQSLGYASHRAMHRRERERAKKLQQPPVIKSVCDCPERDDCAGYGAVGERARGACIKNKQTVL